MSFQSEAEMVWKALDIEGVKTFRCRALVPPMKGPWIITTSPLKVVDEDGKRVGFALTRLGIRGRESIGVEVEMFLASETPERLDIEIGRPIYVCPYEFCNLYSGKNFENMVGHQLKSLVLSNKAERFDLRGGVIETGPVLEDDD
jgi:hypothetical protein